MYWGINLLVTKLLLPSKFFFLAPRFFRSRVFQTPVFCPSAFFITALHVTSNEVGQEEDQA